MESEGALQPARHTSGSGGSASTVPLINLDDDDTASQASSTSGNIPAGMAGVRRHMTHGAGAMHRSASDITMGPSAYAPALGSSSAPGVPGRMSGPQMQEVGAGSSTGYVYSDSASSSSTGMVLVGQQHGPLGMGGPQTFAYPSPQFAFAPGALPLGGGSPIGTPADTRVPVAGSNSPFGVFK